MFIRSDADVVEVPGKAVTKYTTFTSKDLKNVEKNTPTWFDHRLRKPVHLWFCFPRAAFHSHVERSRTLQSCQRDVYRYTRHVRLYCVNETACVCPYHSPSYPQLVQSNLARIYYRRTKLPRTRWIDFSVHQRPYASSTEGVVCRRMTARCSGINSSRRFINILSALKGSPLQRISSTFNSQCSFHPAAV